VIVNRRSTLRDPRGIAYTGFMVTLTDDARLKLRSLLDDEADPAAGLRVEVVPGGCSGFEYDLSLAEPQEGDEVVESGGVRVIVDRYSVPYLLGVELDYEEGFQGAGFLIRNPNATASCGCGKSFQA
jgi:iron-sulfur cluster insertion protein